MKLMMTAALCAVMSAPAFAQQTLEFEVTPVLPQYVGGAPPEGEQRPMLGIAWDRAGSMDIDHPGPNEQIKASVMAGWRHSTRLALRVV